MRVHLTLAALLALAGCAAAQSPVYPAASVTALRETAPVGTPNADAADDPAIWRNRADPQASLILGTDKKAGLYVYGLDGTVRDFVPADALNNVDLRDVDFPGGGGHAILVGASDRGDPAVPRIALFRLDGATGKLTPLGAVPVFPESRAVPAEAYGFCMGAPLAPGELARSYVVMKDGEVAESRLVARGGGIAAEYLRSVRVSSQAEGCVVDDQAQRLYLAEEDVGIWHFDLAVAAPQAVVFARVGEADGLAADVEGLALGSQGGRRLLVASSQGDNAYAVFDTANGRLSGRFRIAAGPVGATSETDGIELVTGDFGPDFPAGLFVAQDGDNAPGAQNFKMVSWQSIAAALKLSD